MQIVQKLNGAVRKAVSEYQMISPGDHVAVGVSGGKDSLALLYGLAKLRQYGGIPYRLTALTLDPCFGGEETDFSPLSRLCEALEVEHLIRRTNIGRVVFDVRQEPNPCSLCSRMRHGALNDWCKELGCQKIALGHHRDDAVETFIMNLFLEGRLHCFSPVSYLTRKDLTMIRPLVFLTEQDIRRAVAKLELPVVKSRCPIDGKTSREWAKQWLAGMEAEKIPDLRQKIFGTMRRSHLSDW